MPKREYPEATSGGGRAYERLCRAIDEKNRVDRSPGPVHVSTAVSPWLREMQEARQAWTDRFGKHADELTRRINLTAQRHPFCSMSSCRHYSDPLGSMVNLIAGAEIDGDRLVATKILNDLSAFVSALLAEGEPDLGLATVLYLDVSKLLGQAAKDAGEAKHYVACAVLIEHATDWLQRGLTFVGASVKQVVDMVQAIAAVPLRSAAE